MITRWPRLLPPAASLRRVVTPKTSPIPTTANEQGLTLIECLVAIIMVALVASAIAPALVISVASRVQSQKAEQALKLAQTEIDRVRVSVERREATADDLPLPVEGVADRDIVAVDGPNYGAFAAAGARPTVTQTRQVDVTGNGENDFAVQIFRSPGGPDVGGIPIAFAMGVRVYDLDAVDSGRTGSLLTEPASLGIVSTAGERRERPLAALYTTISVGDTSESLCDYITYYNNRDGEDFDLPLGCPGAPEPEE